MTVMLLLCVLAFSMVMYDSQDHFNDTVSNGLSVLAVGLASTYDSVWWLDPGFAMLFSVFIIVVWANTGKGAKRTLCVLLQRDQ
jgi:divalent metal cation (Fe/Co/Zn/Cd) transporter